MYPQELAQPSFGAAQRSAYQLQYRPQAQIQYVQVPVSSRPPFAPAYRSSYPSLPVTVFGHKA